MKEFPPETVHLAVSLVDRYLQLREVKRTKLQLVGISAILLAARWMGQLIITIREAAWLTDNTYKYEQVVRMMGEVLAVFRGDLRVCLCVLVVCRKWMTIVVCRHMRIIDRHSCSSYWARIILLW